MVFEGLLQWCWFAEDGCTVGWAVAWSWIGVVGELLNKATWRSLSQIGEGKGSTDAPLSNSVVVWAPINSLCRMLMDGLKTLPLIPSLSVVALIGFLEHGCAVAWFKCNSSCRMLLDALTMIWPSTGFVDCGCSVACWCYGLVIMFQANMISVALSILSWFSTWRFLAKSLESTTGITFSFFTTFHVITLSQREVERTLIISLWVAWPITVTYSVALSRYRHGFYHF